MNKNKEVIANIEKFCNEIIDRQRIAILAMQLDMENTFLENEEEIVVFNEPHIGFIGVSYIDKNLRFINSDGTTELANSFNEAYFDKFVSVWHAFHNDR